MMAERRRNSGLAAVIAQAVELDRSQGCAVAWAYASKWGVPASTLTRVLSLGGTRRAPDNPMADPPVSLPAFVVLDTVPMEQTPATNAVPKPG